MSGLQAGAPFPTTGGCTGRTNVSTEHGPALAPATSTPLSVTGNPIDVVIDKDNVAYVTTSEGMIYAFTLDTPGQRWQSTLQATPIVTASGSMVIAATGVLYAANDTEIHAFSTVDGSEIEPPLAALGTINSDMDMLPGGRLVFTDTASQVESMDTIPSLKTGPTGTLPNYVYSASYFANAVWVGDGLCNLWPLAPSNMQPQGSPLKETGQYMVAVGGPDGKLRVFWSDNSGYTIAAIDPSNLSQSWMQNQPSTSGTQGIAVTLDGTTWITDPGTLHTFASDGTPGPSWGNGVRFPAYDIDGYVYFTQGSGALGSADKTGAIRWNAPQYQDLLYAMVVAKNGILVGLGQQPTVYVYHP